MIVNILLLEDNENIAQSFIRNFSSELVRVKVVKTIAELFHELSNQEFDTIIIDPIMSATMDFPRLLEELSRKEPKLKLLIQIKLFLISRIMLKKRISKMCL